MTTAGSTNHINSHQSIETMNSNTYSAAVHRELKARMHKEQPTTKQSKHIAEVIIGVGILALITITAFIIT